MHCIFKYFQFLSINVGQNNTGAIKTAFYAVLSLAYYETKIKT